MLKFKQFHLKMSKLKSNELGFPMNGYHNDLNNNSNHQVNGTQDFDRSILYQLEFYFSRENLLHDKYLLSQMDSDNYVPISILIQFNKMKKLFANSNYKSSSDQERIIIIQNLVKLNPNSKLQLDVPGNKLRANHKRCVVIIREINKETPVESIINIFEQCKVKCLNCEFAGSRSWYLTFKDEQEAQVAVQFIKEEAQSFNDQPLFARIKTNPIPRVNSANNTINTNNPNEQEKIEIYSDLSKNYGFSIYPTYYYQPEFSYMTSSWMLYPSTPNQLTSNFSKLKQASNDNNSFGNSISSTSVSNYLSSIDPIIFSYGSYPMHKRKNINKPKTETDTNSSQNEENEDNNTRNHYRRCNIGPYNQNFIILPNPTPYNYAPGPTSHLAYNFVTYPSLVHSAQQLFNQPSSSSSSTSSKPSNQADPRSNQQKAYRYNKKYTSNQGITKSNTDNDVKEKRNIVKYSKLNAKPTNLSFKKSGKNGSSRKDESLVQFDYEPTSFPPLNDKNDNKVQIDPDIYNPEELIYNPQTSNDSNSAWSRKSFAEIVKIPSYSLSQDLAKAVISED